MTAHLRLLLMKTIYAPVEAARLIAALNLPSETGWVAMLLGAIVNTFAYTLNLALFPIPADFPLPVLQSPFQYLILTFSMSVMFVFTFVWIGQILGGKARLATMVLMLSWLMLVYGLANFALLLLIMLVPFLGGLTSLAVLFYTVWVLLVFLKVAHGFPNMGKAVVTIVLSVFGLLVGLSFFFSAIGFTALGIS